MGNELAIRNIVDGYTISDLTSIASITVKYGYDAPTLELLLKNGDNTNEEGQSFGISVKSLSNQHNLNHRVVITTLEELGLIDNTLKLLTPKGFLETNGIDVESFKGMKSKDLNKIRPLLEYREGGWRIDRSNDNFSSFWDMVVGAVGDKGFNILLKKQKHPQTESTQKLIRAMRKAMRNGV